MYRCGQAFEGHRTLGDQGHMSMACMRDPETSPPRPFVRYFNAGVAGLYELQVLLLGRAENIDSGGGVTQTFGGGGLTAEYFANTRFMGKALVTRVRHI